MFLHLRTFVEDAYGTPAWNAILARAGVGPRIYLPIKAYPDEELVELLQAASEVSGRPIPELLQAFGQRVAPSLLAMYRHLLNPAWRTLDILEHTETTAHRAVRLEQREAAPPYLEARRLGENCVEINYTSARRLCSVARGIIDGLAAHFGEDVTVDEPECMHRGASRCRLLVGVSGYAPRTA